jgi:hypothetical protein
MIDQNSNGRTSRCTTRQLFRLSNLFGLSQLFGLSLLGLSLSCHHRDPAAAHTVKTGADIAATFHLEPSHNPRAGEPATVWFALTKLRGEIVPLQDCDCQLQVQQSGKSIDTSIDTSIDPSIAQPILKAISVEQYQGIPGSEVVFPSVGIYNLEISGKPKEGHAFEPFKFTYQVTVQPGNPPSASPDPSRAKADQAQPDHQPPMPATPASPSAPIGLGPWFVGGTIGAVVMGAIVFRQRRS